ncbi:hypothetical protein [Oribacterium sp. WCC10]|uniref:hypothetical protein n=1 Tax=Oribacterium sp. WCC10 TaxID=1855343 RepID=UPI003FA60A55
MKRIHRRQRRDNSCDTGISFRATVKVSVSRTFYAWVFQFAGGIRIAGPEGVREEYMEMLKDAMK